MFCELSPFENPPEAIGNQFVASSLHWIVLSVTESAPVATKNGFPILPFPVTPFT